MKVQNLVQCIGLFSTSEDESKPNLEALVPKGFFDDCEKEKLALAKVFAEDQFSNKKSIAFDNDFVVCEPDLPKTNHFSFQSRTGKTFFGTSLRFHETSLRGDNYLCRFLFVMTTTNQFYFSEMLSKLVFLSCVVDRLPEPLLFEHLFVSLPRTSPSQSQIVLSIFN
ncbi:hypothetical protein MHBO_001163 [Bonamia ostreae]|uniref:Uncharacterized protein n=1 Tax=Bonamia ostreae TaxID=126728 RepID=A0ABV2AHZ3_9EUKA